MVFVQKTLGFTVSNNFLGWRSCLVKPKDLNTNTLGSKRQTWDFVWFKDDSTSNNEWIGSSKVGSYWYPPVVFVTEPPNYSYIYIDYKPNLVKPLVDYSRNFTVTVTSFFSSSCRLRPSLVPSCSIRFFSCWQVMYYSFRDGEVRPRQTHPIFEFPENINHPAKWGIPHLWNPPYTFIMFYIYIYDSGHAPS